MKKLIVSVLIMLMLFSFSSCSQDTSGYVYELTSHKWSADFVTGANIKLSFFGDKANLEINSGDSNTKIDGKYIADENSFTIFEPEIFQNYEFSYWINGNKLKLKYDNKTVEMNIDD